MNASGFSEKTLLQENSFETRKLAIRYPQGLPLFLLFLGCWAYGFFNVFNTDFGFSVRMGEYLREHQYQVPQETIFLAHQEPRYSPDDKWVFHIFVSWFYDLGGINGLICFRLLLIGVAFFFLYQALCFQNSAWASLIFCLMAILGASEQFMIRSTLLSITFICLHLYLYSSPMTLKKGVILGISLWVWANCHAYFVFGQWLFLGWFFVHFFSKTSSESKKFLSLMFLLCFLIPLLNPHGVRVYSFPWTVLMNLFAHSEYYQSSLTELVSPFAHEDFPSWAQRLYFLSLALCFFSVLEVFQKWRTKRLCLEEQMRFFWFFCFFGMSILVRKNVGVWVPVATVFWAPYVSKAFQRLPIKGQKQMFKWIGILVAGIGYLYYLWLPLSNTLYIQEQKQQRSQWGLNEMIFPKKAVDYLLEHQLPMPLFNNYEIGSYLVYRCFPQTSIRPYITTDYGSGGLALVEQYQKILRGQISLSDVQQSQKIRTFLLKHTSANTQFLIQQLFQSSAYEVVYVDELALIFVDRETAQKLEKKFFEPLTIQEKTVSQGFFREIPWKKFFWAGFFQQRNTQSWLQRSETLYMECLEEYPDYPKAQMNLASLEATLGGKKGLSLAICLANRLAQKYPKYRQVARFREQLQENIEQYQWLLRYPTPENQEQQSLLQHYFQESDRVELQNWFSQQVFELQQGTVFSNRENALRTILQPLERERWRQLLDKI